MKYRIIKRVVAEGDTCKYIAQVKRWWGWNTIDWCYNRAETAEHYIARHHASQQPKSKLPPDEVVKEIEL